MYHAAISTYRPTSYLQKKTTESTHIKDITIRRYPFPNSTLWRGTHGSAEQLAQGLGGTVPPSVTRGRTRHKGKEGCSRLHIFSTSFESSRFLLIQAIYVSLPCPAASR